MNDLNIYFSLQCITYLECVRNSGDAPALDPPRAGLKPQASGDPKVLAEVETRRVHLC
jgi:hypothetical protein